MDTITFKNFISEDFADDFRRKLQMAQKDIADDVDVRRYRISITNGKIMPSSDISVSIAVPVPDEYLDSRDFFDRITRLSVEKALKKYFQYFEIAQIADIPWDGSQAVSITAAVATSEA